MQAGLRAIFTERKPIAGLDGVRALCVLLVLADHSRIPGFEGWGGKVGVFLFFTISGFLITPILYRARKKVEANSLRPRDALRDFLIKRILRIFPLYYVSLTVFVVPLLLLSRAKGTELYARFGDILPWLYGYGTNIYVAHIAHAWPGSLSHFWSLAVEQQYYVVFPLLFVGLATRRWPVALLVFAGVTLAIGWLWFGGRDDIVFYASTLTGFYALALGGWFGLRAMDVPRQGSPMSDAGIILLFVAQCALAFWLHGSQPGGDIATTALPPLAGMLLLLLTRAQNGTLVALLETPVLRGLGVVSYGFYIFHNLVLGQTNALTRHMIEIFVVTAPPADSASFTMARFAVSLVITFALSILFFVVLERPLLRLRGPRAA